jgi:Domain of unknown function (DUF5615)
MKIKLDENPSQRLCEFLVALKRDVNTVINENLSGADDFDVLKAASSEDRYPFHS